MRIIFCRATKKCAVCVGPIKRIITLHTTMNKIYLSFLLSVFAIGVGLLMPDVTHAMVIRGGETFELEPYTTLEDDLYVAGKTVSLAGTTTGDVFAAGSQVAHSGVSTEDMLFAGGEVNVTGVVQGDLRVLGGEIILSGHVTEDVVLIGGTIHITEEAVIDGDVVVVGEYVSSKGTIGGIVEAYTRVIEFTGGSIGGSLRAYTRESLSVTGTTRIEGDLEYKAPHEAFVSETASVAGERLYTPLQTSRADNGKVDIVKLIELILITVVAAVTLVFFFPAHTRALSDIALRKGNPINFVKGFLILIFVPIVSLLVMITMIGIVPGFIMLSVYFVLVCVALALAPVLAGIFLARSFKKTSEELSLAWVSFGAIAFTLISILPFIGFAVRLLVFLLAFYATAVLLYEHVWVQRKKQQIEAEKKPLYDSKETSDSEITTTP